MTDPIKPMHDVDALARRLPRREPRSDRAEAMRRAVLDAAQLPRPWWTGKRVRRGAIAVGVMAAAAACALIALRTADHRAASVDGTDRLAGGSIASLENAGLPGGSLREGRTTIDATRPVHLTHGEATITAPPGARFDIEVHGDQVKLITVKAGWVVIASAHMAATVVAERHTWTPEAPPSPEPPAAPSPPPPSSPTTVPPALPRDVHTAAPAHTAAAPVTPPSSDAAPRAPSLPSITPAPPGQAAAVPEAASSPAAAGAAAAATVEQEFHSGLRTLLAGNADAATDPLDRACSAASTAQDDICYWAAIAWLRAGDRVHARRSLEDVLARWPRSTHAGEANVALGRLLLDQGDRVGARARFAAAAEDRVPGVRAEALRGLAAAQ